MKKFKSWDVVKYTFEGNVSIGVIVEEGDIVSSSLLDTDMIFWLTGPLEDDNIVLQDLDTFADDELYLIGNAKEVFRGLAKELINAKL